MVAAQRRGEAVSEATLGLVPRPFNACAWLIDRHLEAGRDRTIAIVTAGRSYTYGQVHEQVTTASGRLRALRVDAEDRVIIALDDTIEFLAAFLGAMRLGAIPVPVNPLLPAGDLAAIVRLSRARVVLLEPRIDPRAVQAGAPEVEHPIVVRRGGVPDSDAVRWEGLAGTAPGAPYDTWDESPGFWLCTSGTTGHPKLVMHRHADVRVTAETYGRHVLEIDATDRCFSVAPMFHAYGLGNSLTFPLAVGASAVLEPTRPPTPSTVASTVTACEPTLFFSIPTFYAALASADLPPGTFSTVRRAVSAAEPLPAEVWRQFRERVSVEILDGLGSTEALHIFVSNVAGSVRPGTSGVPVPGYEVRLEDATGASPGPGDPGFLQVKGDSTATGYWCAAEWSRRTFVGEWLQTGDLYTVSGDGYYTYLGRADDMLRVSGEWVSPAEVEATLVEHPAVLEAAVVGETNEAGLQQPVAHVVLGPGLTVDPGDLIEFCRSRLAGFKRPRRVAIVDQLPKTTTGKVKRFELRAHAHELRGAHP
ncbi:MAG: benzoate-CoA ligase family protein, partial [Gaiellales bacterium]